MSEQEELEEYLEEEEKQKQYHVSYNITVIQNLPLVASKIELPRSRPSIIREVESQFLAKVAKAIRTRFDLEKYRKAYSYLDMYFREHGYRDLAGAFSELYGMKIFVVPYPYRERLEDIAVQMVATLNGWDRYERKTLQAFIMERKNDLKELGIPLEQLVYFLSSSRTKVQLREGSAIEAQGGVAIGPASLGAGGRKEAELSIESEPQRPHDVLRHAVLMLLSSIDKPTVLILRDEELEFLGASGVLDAIIGNPNLSVLLFLPDKPSEEFREIVVSDRVASFAMITNARTMKETIINMYQKLCTKDETLLERIWGLRDREKKTKQGIRDTILLLLYSGTLQRTVDKLIYEYNISDPLLIVDATNRVISYVYSLIEVKPKRLVELYRKGERMIKNGIKNDLFRIVESILDSRVIPEVSYEYLRQSGIANIVSMIKAFNVPESKVLLYLKSGTLRELSYPLPVDDQDVQMLFEFLRKLGVVKVMSTKRGMYNLYPGMSYLYNNVKRIITVEVEKNGA